jgi:glycerol kinase
VLDVPVERPASHETTAWGAAMLAGITTGAIAGTSDAAARWRAAARFDPEMRSEEREGRLALWQSAVARALG